MDHVRQVCGRLRRVLHRARGDEERNREAPSLECAAFGQHVPLVGAERQPRSLALRDQLRHAASLLPQIVGGEGSAHRPDGAHVQLGPAGVQHQLRLSCGDREADGVGRPGADFLPEVPPAAGGGEADGDHVRADR